MPYIYLHKLELPEKNRVDPDEIRMIDPMEAVKGSIVTFTNNDVRCDIKKPLKKSSARNGRCGISGQMWRES